MNTDNFIKQGNSHNICEDYSLHGILNRPYIIVSDGCSTSSNTDIGARLICHKLKNKLENYNIIFTEHNFRMLIHECRNIINNLDLPKSSLDATFIMGYLEKNLFKIFVKGDGIIINKKRSSEEIEIIDFFLFT